MDTTLYAHHQQPGGQFSVIDRQFHPEGDVWWVGSAVTGANDSAGYGSDPDKPFATLEYAVETASAAGDTIFVLPSHTETVGATGAVAISFAKARVHVYGLGGRTTKPQILIDAYTDTYCSISAADVRIQNVAFLSGIDDLAMALSITAAGAQILGCDFLENTTAEDMLISIYASDAAHDLVIDDCLFLGVGQATECIEVKGSVSRLKITNNRIEGLFSVAAISVTTAAPLGVLIADNYIGNHTTAGTDLAGSIDLYGNATGWIMRNRIYLGDDDDCLTSIDAGYCALANNFAINEYDEESGPAFPKAT